MKLPLQGLRVVEMGQGIAESFAGKMFAAQGADVIKVESPGDDGKSRRTGPDAESHRFGQSPGYFHYLNTSKRSVTLDIDSDDGARLLARLLTTSDVLIDGTRAGALDSETVGAQFPRLVHVSITPFGRSGPYAEFAATEIVLHAMTGEMNLAGMPDKAPLQKGGHFAQVHGGLHGYVAAMAALTARKKTGRGQFVDVSIAEAWVSVAGSALKQQTYGCKPPGARKEQGPVPQRSPEVLGRMGDRWRKGRKAQLVATLPKDDRAAGTGRFRAGDG